MFRACFHVISFILVLFLVACGLPGVTELTATPMPPTATAAPTAEPVLEPTAAPTATPASGAVDSFADVQSAVIRVVARGSFVQPGELQAQSFAGQGSGFIIDPAGIAVTNNHVVTGAALLEVFVGEEEKPRNARVLGVSECSDLAVIDIDGEDFPYLEWYEDDITPGLEVRSAGFPLNDPEYTVNQGIVSKARANGNTPWASVDNVIEHDVAIRPGNSGGPLVTRDSGQVLAINYAGFAGGPHYAIGREEARPLIEQLKTNEDVTSIGINGVAINTGEISGIWVSSVESGSPADAARIQPGDFITTLEGLMLATDGTMADYCDILRSRDSSATMTVEVARIAEDQVTFLEGQLNGRELEVIENAAFEPVEDPVAPAQPTAVPAEPPAAESSISPLPPLDPASLQQARDNHNALRGRLRQIIFETFDRGNVTRASWPEGESSTTLARLRNNVYELTLNQPETIHNFFWLEGDSSGRFGRNYILELDVAFGASGQPGGVGIVFDGQANDDGSAFFINSDGSWQVVSFVDGAFSADWSSSAFSTSTIIDGVNQLRVVRLAEGTEFWINNTPVGVMEPGPFNGGSGGVVAVSGSAASGPVTVLADNFRALEE
jgi:S1-C subfamily serine protease